MFYLLEMVGLPEDTRLLACGLLAADVSSSLDFSLLDEWDNENLGVL